MPGGRPRRKAARHGSKSLRDLEDRQLLVQEDNVDREAHEAGVDRPGRPDQHALTAAQLTAAEQPKAAAEDAVGEVAAFADDLAFRADEDERVQSFPPFISAGQYRLGSRKRRLPTGWSDYPPVRPCGRSEAAGRAIEIDPSNARAIGPGEIQPEGILFMMDRFNVWVGSIVARSQDKFKKRRGPDLRRVRARPRRRRGGAAGAMRLTGLADAIAGRNGQRHRRDHAARRSSTRDRSGPPLRRRPLT